MLFHYTIIGICFFLLIFRTVLRNILILLIIAMLIGFIWLNLMRAFTWGISFRDPLGNIELILISFCSIGLPISYNLLERKK